jgi:hypothetical protein
MKIYADVVKRETMELEVDDKFLPLSDDDFWENNNEEAEELADELRTIIKGKTSAIYDVLGAELKGGGLLFED